MPETWRATYDNKPQLLHQVGTPRHFHYKGSSVTKATTISADSN